MPFLPRFFAGRYPFESLFLGYHGLVCLSYTDIDCDSADKIVSFMTLIWYSTAKPTKVATQPKLMSSS